jgi:hypothetical protein
LSPTETATRVTVPADEKLRSSSRVGVIVPVAETVVL